MACLQMIVQLYKDLMKVYMNPTSIYEGSIEVVEHRDKDPAEGLEKLNHLLSAVTKRSRHI
jgi:hypothetical protein